MTETTDNQDCFGHTIETDGIYWSVRCTHSPDDSVWFCRSQETGEITERSCWVQSWEDHDWANDLAVVISRTRQGPATVAAITIAPDADCGFNITSFASIDGGNPLGGFDHTIQTDGSEWYATCLHPTTDHWMMKDGHCVTSDDREDGGCIADAIDAAAARPESFSLGTIDIDWNGDGPLVSDFVPCVRFVMASEPSQSTGAETP